VPLHHLTAKKHKKPKISVNGGERVKSSTINMTDLCDFKIIINFIKVKQQLLNGSQRRKMLFAHGVHLPAGVKWVTLTTKP